MQKNATQVLIKKQGARRAVPCRTTVIDYCVLPLMTLIFPLHLAAVSCCFLADLCFFLLASVKKWAKRKPSQTKQALMTVNTASGAAKNKCKKNKGLSTSSVAHSWVERGQNDLRSAKASLQSMFRAARQLKGSGKSDKRIFARHWSETKSSLDWASAEGK